MRTDDLITYKGRSYVSLEMYTSLLVDLMENREKYLKHVLGLQLSSPASEGKQECKHLYVSFNK